MSTPMEHPLPTLSDAELAETATRMQSGDTAFTTYLQEFMNRAAAEIYTLDENGTVTTGGDIDTSIVNNVNHILALYNEIDPQKKLPEGKVALRIIQALEKGFAQAPVAVRIQNLCKIALIGVVSKPDDVPDNLSRENVQNWLTPIRKRPKEGAGEKAYRCAILALRNQYLAPYSNPRMAALAEELQNANEARDNLIDIKLRDPDTAPLTATTLNEKLVKAVARSFMWRLADPSVTRSKVEKELAVRGYLKKYNTVEDLLEDAGQASIQAPQAEAESRPEETQPELPVQYVDWEPIPPSSIEELGITLPPSASRANQGRPAGGTEKLNPRDLERFKLLAEIALECCGDWEWGDEFGKVRMVRARIRGGGEGTRRRLNRYRVGIFPKRLGDGRIVEDAAAIGRYGNAALVWSAEFGMVDGEMQHAWPEVFQNRKPEIVAMGAKWLKHSPHIKERILAVLMEHRGQANLQA